MSIIIEKDSRRTNGWISGTSGEYSFQAKVYDERSKHGILGGRVSKLAILDANDKVVFNYDRGYDEFKYDDEPVPTIVVTRIVGFLENLEQVGG